MDLLIFIVLRLRNLKIFTNSLLKCITININSIFSEKQLVFKQKKLGEKSNIGLYFLLISLIFDLIEES